MKLLLATVSLGENPVGRGVAIRTLRRWVRRDPVLAEQVEIALLECGTEATVAELAARMRAEDPDVIGLSCYLWGSPQLIAAAGRVAGLAAAGVLPVLLGGPDASTRAEALLAAHPFLTAVCQEEGEEALRGWLSVHLGLEPGPAPGWLTRAGRTAPLPFLDLDLLPSPDPEERAGVLTLESARGCRYPCAYCLYNLTGRRARSVDKLLADIDRFVAEGGGELYLVDAGLDHDRPRMRVLLRALAERVEQGAPLRIGHLELQLEDLTGEELDLLARVRAPLAIGLQSTHLPTTQNVRRPYRPARFRARAGALVRRGLRFHLDLIYGLPGDDFATFQKSLDDAWALAPTLVHPMRLAVLPGSPLAREVARWGLVYDPEPPYWLQQSDSWSPGDLARAHRLALAAHAVHTGTFDHHALRLGAAAAGCSPAAWLETWGADVDALARWQADPALAGEAVWRFVQGHFGGAVPAAVEDAFRVQIARGTLLLGPEAHLFGPEAEPSRRGPGWRPRLGPAARLVPVRDPPLEQGRRYAHRLLVRTSAGVHDRGLGQTLADLLVLADGSRTVTALVAEIGEVDPDGAIAAALRDLAASGALC